MRRLLNIFSRDFVAIVRAGFLALVAVALLSFTAAAQDKTNQEEPPKKPVFVSPAARLMAAKTAVVQNGGGSEIPFNVITSGVEGWGHLQLVDSPSKADVIIEVTSPVEDEKPKSSPHVGTSGRMQDSPGNTSSSGPVDIKLVVYDAHTHIALWSATERPKGGFRQRAREDHLVEAASRLMQRLRERLEPTPKP